VSLEGALHTKAEAIVGIKDCSLSDLRPSQSCVDTKFTFCSIVVVKYARLGEKQVAGDRRLPTLEAVFDAFAGIVPVPTDIIFPRAL
jgi:hypothetical protein